MQIYTIDCKDVLSEVDFWQIYLQTVEPEGTHYFGKNLHALWDGVNGGPGWPGLCELHFINTQSLRTLNDCLFYEQLCKLAKKSKTIQIFIE
ncbi:barstar family protein [Undibacterium sp. Rencai35W]|uniref:barstar family protein n=1 Tax=Undibacterium sp. Rencai35W TaxID=3413046 RepID=UPI003BEF71EE